jgi:hypothetical protein
MRRIMLFAWLGFAALSACLFGSAVARLPEMARGTMSGKMGRYRHAVAMGHLVPSVLKRHVAD